ncbi:MAG: hypothetical protein ACP5VQ_08090, partial [Phycisphaerae bacterium]
RNLPVWNLPNPLWFKIPRYELLDDAAQRWVGVIHWARLNPGLHTLVLADRMGDIHTGPLSTPAVMRELGRQWILVKTIRFNWYFQWQYYFYSPMRVRIFRRIVSAKPPPKPPPKHAAVSRPASKLKNL